MNNDNFLIESCDLDLAKEVCGSIVDNENRYRAVASMLGAEIAKKYFTEIDVDNVVTLHEIPNVLEDLELSDIYIKNNYIDVRLFFEGEQLFIPASHLKWDIKPLAYMFIKVDEEITTGNVAGFLITENQNFDITEDNYIKVTEDNLVSFYELNDYLVQSETIDLNEEFELLIHDFLDNKIEDKGEFYSILLKSPEARLKLKNAAKVLEFSNYISFVKDEVVEENDVEDLISASEKNEAESFDLASEDISNDELLISEEEDFLDGEDLLTETLDKLDELNFESQEESQFVQDDLEQNFELEESSIQEMAEVETIEEEPLLELNSEEENDLLNVVEDKDLVELDDLEKNASEVLPEENFVITEEAIVENVAEELESEYSTNISPSLSAYEEILEEELDNLEELQEPEAEITDVKSEIFNDEKNEELEELSQQTNNSEVIDNLFGAEEMSEEEVPSQEIPEATYEEAQYNTKKMNVLPVIGVLALGCALAYYGYTKFSNVEQVQTSHVETSQKVINNEQQVEKPLAMPVESVENTKTLQTNEGTTETISAIESNLDASILVSNLSVRWEVPSGYLSSGTAKRYFTKLGKILQLNLKTELLLLSKPPITDKISVEFEYNKANQKFEIKKFIVSSGEKTVDAVISNTIKRALDINLNMNMGVFENIVGNPVLVIRL